MIDVNQLREFVVRPVLRSMRMYSKAAENLVIGTAAQESGLKFIKQLGGGPALGIYQMEPATEQDLFDNYLSYRPEIMEKVTRLRVIESPNSDLIGNLFYATAMCRLKYWPVKEALPNADDIEGLAHYWKKYYNTEHGHGTVEQFVKNYFDIVLSGG